MRKYIPEAKINFEWPTLAELKKMPANVRLESLEFWCITSVRCNLTHGESSRKEILVNYNYDCRNPKSTSFGIIKTEKSQTRRILEKGRSEKKSK